MLCTVFRIVAVELLLASYSHEIGKRIHVRSNGSQRKGKAVCLQLFIIAHTDKIIGQSQVIDLLHALPEIYCSCFL